MWHEFSRKSQLLKLHRIIQNFSFLGQIFFKEFSRAFTKSLKCKFYYFLPFFIKLFLPIEIFPRASFINHNYSISHDLNSNNFLLFPHFLLWTFLDRIRRDMSVHVSRAWVKKKGKVFHKWIMLIQFHSRLLKAYGLECSKKRGQDAVRPKKRLCDISNKNPPTYLFYLGLCLFLFHFRLNYIKTTAAIFGWKKLQVGAFNGRKCIKSRWSETASICKSTEVSWPRRREQWGNTLRNKMKKHLKKLLLDFRRLSIYWRCFVTEK